jgi:hypothetical protein
VYGINSDTMGKILIVGVVAVAAAALYYYYVYYAKKTQNSDTTAASGAASGVTSGAAFVEDKSVPFYNRESQKGALIPDCMPSCMVYAPYPYEKAGHEYNVMNHRIGKRVCLKVVDTEGTGRACWGCLEGMEKNTWPKVGEDFVTQMLLRYSECA